MAEIRQGKVGVRSERHGRAGPACRRWCQRDTVFFRSRPAAASAAYLHSQGDGRAVLGGGAHRRAAWRRCCPDDGERLQGLSAGRIGLRQIERVRGQQLAGPSVIEAVDQLRHIGMEMREELVGEVAVAQGDVDGWPSPSPPLG